MEEKIYIYVNVKGRIIEYTPDWVYKQEDKYGYFDYYVACSEKQINAEEKRNGFYKRVIGKYQGELYKNTIWFKQPNLDEARKIFYNDIMQRYKKIEKEFNNILTEKETLEEVM